MHFSPYITILDCETNKRVSLEQKSYIKYFGVLIDQNYSRKKRIDPIIKIRKTIGMIARLTEVLCSSTVLINICNSFILPYVTYRLIAWGNGSNAYLNKITVLQERVLRFLYLIDQREHAISLFVKEKILPTFPIL